jgi:hypothetical protein
VSKYYVLDCLAGDGPLQFTLEVGWDAQKSWSRGMPLSASEAHEDYRPPEGIIELNTDIDSKVQQRTYPELTWDPIPLMSRRLVASLLASGVDNLQVFETRLIDPQGENPPAEDHYLAVNIIGAVSATDFAKSQTNPDSTDQLISMDFLSLGIDPSKAREALIFRLAENVTAVLVHERIRQALDRDGFSSLSWFEPEEWAG